MFKKFRSMKNRRHEKSILFASTVASSTIFYDGIIQELQRREYDVQIVSGPGPTCERLFGSTTTIHSLMMSRAIDPLRDIVSLARWIHLLATLRPQIIVLGTPKASLLGGIAARITNTPHIIYVVHGLRSQLTSGLMGKVLTVAENLTLRSAHHVLAVSPSLRREVQKAHPKFQNRIDVLGFGSMNGVDMTRFIPLSKPERDEIRRRYSLSKSAFVVGFVGRLHRDKGADFLIRLMQSTEAVRLDLHLLLIGTIEDDSLYAEIDSLSLQGRITVTGWIDHPEKHIGAIDLLLHPTRREGLGMVLIEAQAAGTPVLTNRVTGAIDAVQDGVGGFFAETDSIDSWVSRITELAEDATCRKAMGIEGRDFVLKRYDRNKVVNNFVKYIAKINQPNKNFL